MKKIVIIMIIIFLSQIDVASAFNQSISVINQNSLSLIEDANFII